jgi:hypothetical protein
LRLGLVVSSALVAAGCASDRASRAEVAAAPCCEDARDVASASEAASPAFAPPAAPLVEPPFEDASDFAARVDGPARCADAAAQLLPAARERAWALLKRCVALGRFTALRALLSGAWDRELSTRGDAPELLARVVAMRGGDVDADVRLLHDRRVPLFSLAQALARPELFRGALVLVRARVDPSGLLDEVRLVGSVRELELEPEERVTAREPAAPAFVERRQVIVRRAENFDVRTGRRALLPADYPFVDPDDVVVLLARFDGLRELDGWPRLSVLAHFRPSALLSY